MLKVFEKIRKDLCEEETKNSMDVGQPHREFLRISHHNEKNAMNPFDGAILPTKKQISNILQYERGKNSKLNFMRTAILKHL